MIVAKNLSYSLKAFNILDQVDVSVDTGELLVIIGPNGAGKSTLLSLLANENKASSGEILFLDKSFKDWSSGDLAQTKAKFSQEYNADIGLPVEDIVLMGRYPYFSTVPHQSDLEIVRLMMEKTEIDHLRKRNYNSLSGGEKQRVHLARVLAQLQNDRPGKVAFFDEPLNNLDIRHQHRILETVREFIDRGNSAVLVLHDLNLAAEFADNVLLLKKGRIVAQGKPDFIFKREIISKAYDFPCAICQNPITKNPMIIFNSRTKNSLTEA